ncbi:MAG: hypothetical protein ACHQT9_05065 [Candidatus Saccharimonadales bacterium]
MDNNPKSNQDPTPENTPSSDPNQNVTEASKAHLSRKGLKTLRPLDSTLVDEIQTQKPVNTQNTVTIPQASESGKPLNTSSTDSIYPEATHLLSGSPDQKQLDNKAEDLRQDNNTTLLIKVLVVVIGLLIVLFSSISLYSWSLYAGFIHFTANPLLIFVIVLTVLELILGIGIAFLKERARSIYVFIAVIFLLFSVYSAVRNYNTIFNFEHQNIAIIFRYFEGLSISVLPILFLTRQRVISVFN